MIKTYKFLKETLTKAEIFKEMNDKELVELYQKKHDDEIITYEFCKHIKLWFRITKKFENIQSVEDISSLVLIAIERALKTFNLNKDYLFTSYTGLVINRELENKIYPSIRRHIDTTSIDKKLDVKDENLTYEDILKDNKDYFNSIEVGDYLKNNKNLTPNELKLCQILMQSDDKIKYKDLENILGLHRHTIRNMKNSLKIKLADLCM